MFYPGPFYPNMPSLPFGHTAVGRCGACKVGIVTVPTMGHCIIPPTPTCTSCGATAKPNDPFGHLPEIDMVPAKPAPQFSWGVGTGTSKWAVWPK